jgi:hypothetical protein
MGKEVLDTKILIWGLAGRCRFDHRIDTCRWDGGLDQVRHPRGK